MDRALTEPDGLLAAGGDLSVRRLLEAYALGIFPWFGEGDPLLWWSPDPRMVLFTDEFHLSRSLRKTLRGGRFRVTMDEAFEAVMRGCAAPRADDAGTWITDEMLDAYLRLADLGHAHAVEVWEGTDLVGGLYGVAIGRMFYGESMFSRRPDASKVALACLTHQLAAWGFPLIDCQMSTPHLASLGAREVPRAVFVREVSRLAGLEGRPGRWTLDASYPAAAAG